MGGHTIARHVGKDAAWLAGRLAKDPAISVASSFSSLRDAENHIAAALRAKHHAITQWQQNQHPSRQHFDYDAGHSVGLGVVRGRSGVQAMTKLRIILIRSVSPTYPFVVQSAFPIL
jgi:hypothetical protein